MTGLLRIDSHLLYIYSCYLLLTPCFQLYRFHSLDCLLTILDLCVQVPRSGLRKWNHLLKISPTSRIRRTSVDSAGPDFRSATSFYSRDTFLLARKHLATFCNSFVFCIFSFVASRSM